MAKKMPYLYEKLRDFLEHAETKKLARDKFREDVASRFRLSKQDTNIVIKELQGYGAIKKRTRKTIEI